MASKRLHGKRVVSVEALQTERLMLACALQGLMLFGVDGIQRTGQPACQLAYNALPPAYSDATILEPKRY